MDTPWGHADYIENLEQQGVYSVGTPGHGGVMVQRQVAQKYLSERAISRGWDYGLYIAYEEDYDWALVAVEHPEWFLGHYVVPSNGPEQYRQATVEEIEHEAREAVWRSKPDYFIAKHFTLHHHLCSYRELMYIARHRLNMNLTDAARLARAYNNLPTEHAKIVYGFAMHFLGWGFTMCCAEWVRR